MAAPPFTRLTCIGAREKLALSFREMEDDEEAHIRVVPPLLRREVLSCESTEGDYLHGYMVNSGFGENILHWHSAHPEIPLHFFWDKQDEAEVCRVDDTLSFHQLDDVKFLRYMAGCKAYATTAGFESVCEAMYLGKPLLMVPAHIEQDCNAYDAFRSGAGVISEEFDLERLLDFSEHFRPNMAFRYWVRSCDWRILRCIEREEKRKPFSGFPLPAVLSFRRLKCSRSSHWLPMPLRWRRLLQSRLSEFYPRYFFHAIYVLKVEHTNR